MCTFTLESTHFIFNKCPIYTHDAASAKFSTNSQETDLQCTVMQQLPFYSSSFHLLLSSNLHLYQLFIFIISSSYSFSWCLSTYFISFIKSPLSIFNHVTPFLIIFSSFLYFLLVNLTFLVILLLNNIPLIIFISSQFSRCFWYPHYPSHSPAGHLTCTLNLILSLYRSFSSKSFRRPSPSFSFSYWSSYF